MALAMAESGEPSGLSRGVAVFQSENVATSEDLRPEMEAWNPDSGGGAAPGCQGRDPAPGWPGWGMSTPTESGAEGPLGWDRAWSPNGATREGAAQHGPCRKRQGLCREEERGFDNVETGGPTHGGGVGQGRKHSLPSAGCREQGPSPGDGQVSKQEGGVRRLRTAGPSSRLHRGIREAGVSSDGGKGSTSGVAKGTKAQS